MIAQAHPEPSGREPLHREGTHWNVIERRAQQTPAVLPVGFDDVDRAFRAFFHKRDLPIPTVSGDTIDKSFYEWAAKYAL